MLWFTINVFFFLSAVVVLFALYVYWKKHTHTREHFAFAILSSSVFLSLFVLTALWVQQTPWAAALGIIKPLLGLEHIAPERLSTEQLILTLIVWAGLLWLLWNMYNNWNGQKSQEQYQREQAGAGTNLFAESILSFNHLSGIKRIEIYRESDEDKHTMLKIAVADLTWREQALDLIELARQDYRFERNWHSEAACWIGTHQGTGERIVLAAWQNQAEAESRFAELQTYIERVKQGQDWQQAVLYVIAIQDGAVNNKAWQINNHSVWLVSEFALLDNLVNFGDYFRHISQQVEQDRLQDTEITIKDIYTVSHYRLEKRGEIQQDIEAYISDWLSESGLRQMAILGDYGQGKSTLSLMYSYQLMQQVEAGNKNVRIPILLTLRGKSPRNLQPDELLSTWAGRFGIDTRALMKLLVAGRLLLIFEGFDEVDLAGDSEARLQHFQVLWSLCYRHAKILITGRPNFFLDDEELKCALGIQERSLERPYCQALWLAPFDVAKMEHALRSETVQIRQEILALAKRDAKFAEVVARPSMLRIVSFLWQRENLAQHQSRINSALVMNEFVRHTLERQAAKDKPLQYMQLNPAEREYFMAGIAVYMLVNDLPNQVPYQQLDQLIAQLVKIIPDSVSQQGNVLAGRSRRSLRQRLQEAKEGYEKALDGIKNDVRACGLLEADVSRNGSFKFGHKSFMEFLAGKVFAQHWVKAQLPEVERLSAESLINQLKPKHKAIVEQPESLIFAAEWASQYQSGGTDEEKASLLFEFVFNQCGFFSKKLNFLLKKLLLVLNYSTLYFPEKIVNKFNIGFATSFSYLLLAVASVGVVVGVVADVAAHAAIGVLAVVGVVAATGIVAGVLAGVLAAGYYRQKSDLRKSGVVAGVGVVAGAGVVASAVTLIFVSADYLFNYFAKELPSWLTINIFFIGIFIYFIIILLLILFSGLNEGRLKREPKYIWTHFEHWHTVCENAKLSRTAMESVVGKGGLRLIEATKQSDTNE